MSEWFIQRLEEIIEVNPKVKLTKGEVYPFIDIDKLSPVLRSVTNEEEKIYDGQSCSKFSNGDTVFSRITPCLENRKIAKVNIEKGAAFGSTEFYIFRAKQGLADPDFVYYLTSSDAVVLPAINSMTGASGRQRADKRFIERTKLNIPVLSTQKRIAKILSAYDDLIENNNHRIALLEKSAQELYKEWFVRFRFPGYEKARFENGLPEGWEFMKLSKVLTVFYGKDHSKLEDGNIPVYGSGGIMRYCEHALYEGESVLIPRKGSLNNIMWVNQPFWTVDTMFYTKALIPNIEKYIYYVLSALDMASFNTGAALPSMTTDILYHLKIVVPSETLLEKFDDIVSGLYEQRTMLESKNNNLIKQRDLLLPRLMSGKLEV